MDAINENLSIPDEKLKTTFTNAKRRLEYFHDRHAHKLLKKKLINMEGISSTIVGLQFSDAFNATATDIDKLTAKDQSEEES